MGVGTRELPGGFLDSHPVVTESARIDGKTSARLMFDSRLEQVEGIVALPFGVLHQKAVNYLLDECT